MYDLGTPCPIPDPVHGTDRSVSGQESWTFVQLRGIRVKENEFAHGLARRLIELQNADGGWAMAEAGASATEPTSWALRALDPIVRDPGFEVPTADSRERAVNWLSLRQLPSGAWPGSERVPEPGASTGVAALALATCPEPALRDRAVAGGAWLLEHPGKRIPWQTRLWFRWNPDRNPLEIDMRFRGWPWMTGTWGWVEPTAIALITFRVLGERLPQSVTRARMSRTISNCSSYCWPSCHLKNPCSWRPVLAVRKKIICISWLSILLTTSSLPYFVFESFSGNPGVCPGP